METSYRTSQTSKLELFTAKVISLYSQNQSLQKVPPYMFERVLNNIYFYFDEYNSL